MHMPGHSKTAFILATGVYTLMLADLVCGAWRGDLSRFTMFGAPAAVILLFFYLLNTPPARERWAVLAGGIALEYLRVLALKDYSPEGGKLQDNLSIFFGSAPGEMNTWFSFPHGFGLGLGIAVTVALWLRATRLASLRVHLTALMLTQVFLLYSMAIIMLIAVVPYTFDTELHHFETTLGVYVPAFFGKAFAAWPVLSALCTLAYGLLAGAVLGGYFLQQRQKEKPPVDILIASGIAACFAVLYFLVPGCGPLEIFGELFPHAIPLQDYEQYTSAPDPSLWRNAMPSLHTTWALLLATQLFFFHPSRLLGWGAVVYAALVVMATLGTGAHYFVDIVVALPLTLLVQALASFSLPWKDRWIPAAAGALLVTKWLLLLCFEQGFFTFTTAWGMIAVTALICAGLLYRLVLASRR